MQVGEWDSTLPALSWLWDQQDRLPPPNFRGGNVPLPSPLEGQAKQFPSRWNEERAACTNQLYSVLQLTCLGLPAAPQDGHCYFTNEGR